MTKKEITMTIRFKPKSKQYTISIPYPTEKCSIDEICSLLAQKMIQEYPPQNSKESTKIKLYYGIKKQIEKHIQIDQVIV